MARFFKRDKQAAGRNKGEQSKPTGNAPQITGSQSARGVQEPPPPMHWTSSAGPAQPAYPLRINISQHGSTIHQQQGDPVDAEEHHFPGGFVQVDNLLSTSPTTLTESGSAHSHHSGSSQRAPPVVPPTVDRDECFAWFHAVDQDGNGHISAEELRGALFNNGGLSFSMTTVEYLIGIFDRDGSGGIGFEEFEPLWNYMNQWRQMFESFDANNDGTIDANELSGALAHYNLHVGPPILNMLVKKYGITRSRNLHPTHPPRIQMDLDHFVCACVVVRQMCDLYDKCIVGGPGQTQISRDDFLQAVISLP